MPINKKINVRVDWDGSDATRGQRQLAQENTSLIAKMKSNWIGLTAAIGGTILAVKKSLTVYAEQEKAERLLAKTFEKFSKNSKELTKDFREFASAQQQVTKFGDEVTLVAASQLSALTGLTGDGLKKATVAAQDLASALGIDLKTAAQLLGKTIGSGTDALSRYIGKSGLEGITDKGVRAEKVIANLNAKFGGFAKEEGKSAVGQLANISNALGDVQEKIGEALLPVLAPFLRGVAKLAVAFQQLSPAIRGALVTIGLLVPAAIALNAALGPIGLAFVAIGAATAGLVVAYQKLDEIMGLSNEKFEKFQENLEKSFGPLGKLASQLLAAARAADKAQKAQKKYNDELKRTAEADVSRNIVKGTFFAISQNDKLIKVLQKLIRVRRSNADVLRSFTREEEKLLARYHGQLTTIPQIRAEIRRLRGENSQLGNQYKRQRKELEKTPVTPDPKKAAKAERDRFDFIISVRKQELAEIEAQVKKIEVVDEKSGRKRIELERKASLKRSEIIQLDAQKVLANDKISATKREQIAVETQTKIQKELDKRADRIARVNAKIAESDKKTSDNAVQAWQTAYGQISDRLGQLNSIVNQSHQANLANIEREKKARLDAIDATNRAQEKYDAYIRKLDAESFDRRQQEAEKSYNEQKEKLDQELADLQERLAAETDAEQQKELEKQIAENETERIKNENWKKDQERQLKEEKEKKELAEAAKKREKEIADQKEKVEKEYRKKVAEYERKTAIYNKASSIAKAVMDAANAIIAALTIPPPFGQIAAAVVGGLTAVQIGVISSQPLPEVPSFRQGGRILGPGHDRGGVNINAEGGEYVMPKEATLRYFPLLEEMRAMRYATRQNNINNYRTSNRTQTNYNTYNITIESVTDFDDFQEQMTAWQRQNGIIATEA
jgi:hypothetical protein